MTKCKKCGKEFNPFEPTWIDGEDEYHIECMEKKPKNNLNIKR